MTLVSLSNATIDGKKIKSKYHYSIVSCFHLLCRLGATFTIPACHIKKKRTRKTKLRPHFDKRKSKSTAFAFTVFSPRILGENPLEGAPDDAKLDWIPARWETDTESTKID